MAVEVAPGHGGSHIHITFLQIACCELKRQIEHVA